jgi:CheY-like chemotaxis protein
MQTDTPQIHLLVATGEPVRRRILSHVLKEAGYLVTSAQDGLEALFIFNTFQETQKSFELLIFDLSLPKINSVELVKRLEKNTCQIPIFIITPTTNLIREKFPANMNIQIIKTPFFKTELLDAIQKTLQDDAHFSS